MTLKDLQWTKNDLKWLEGTYNEQETTYNDLQRTDSNFMEALYLKNNQLKGLDNTKKPYINTLFAIFCTICAFAKWLQAEKSEQTSEQNEAIWKNIE